MAANHRFYCTFCNAPIEGNGQTCPACEIKVQSYLNFEKREARRRMKDSEKYVDKSELLVKIHEANPQTVADVIAVICSV